MVKMGIEEREEINSTKGKKELSKVWKACQEYRLFLFLLLAMDLSFGFLLWLMDAKGFLVLAGIFAVIITGVFFIAVTCMLRREEKREQLVTDFLDALDTSWMQQEFPELEQLSFREREQLLLIGRQFIQEREALQTERQLREDYEEYIETWVHEIKVPLSLMTLLLDNRKEEMSPFLYQRVVYVTNQISEYVTQILYYARLKASHKDYCFERLHLKECCEELLEQYETLLEEEKIGVNLDIADVWVLTDKKGFLFILEQVVSNACKYMDNEKPQREITIRGGLRKEINRIYLSIEDNGIGVKQADLPFLFDRGFTGDTSEKKRKATGMGLYLAKQMAENLNLELKAASEYGQWFSVTVEFPVVEGA